MILPGLPASFEWRDTRTGPAIVCTPLAAVAPHVFTTLPWTLGRSRDDGTAAWAEVAASFSEPARSLVRMQQVHGCEVVVADRGLAPAGSSPLPVGDIVLAGPATDSIVAVQAADCVPILLADPRTGAVAAAHAGWRGMALGVPSAAVRALVRTFGARPEDMLAALGPSIGACCYEVGEDVHRAFESARFTTSQLERWFAGARAVNPAHGPIAALTRDPRPGHWYLDGWQSVREQLVSAGVPPDQVFGADLCTAGQPNLLCSYRRDGAAAGRMAAAITTPDPIRRGLRSAG